MGIEEAVEDHPRNGKGGVEHEPDREHQIEPLHVHFPDAGRRAGMDEHRQRPVIDRLPDGGEKRIGQRRAGDARGNEYTDRPQLESTLELGHRRIRILPG